VIPRFLGLDLFHEVQTFEATRLEAVEFHAVTAKIGNLLDLFICRRMDDVSTVAALMCVAFSGDLAGHPVGKRGITLRFHVG
jgi:hypothetical protein